MASYSSISSASLTSRVPGSNVKRQQRTLSTGSTKAPRKRKISFSAAANAGDEKEGGRATKGSRSVTAAAAAAAAAAVAEVLGQCETHPAFVDALEGLTGDPLEPMGGRVVVYRGNPRAKLMVVGEAPGETEDQVGIFRR